MKQPNEEPHDEPETVEGSTGGDHDGADGAPRSGTVFGATSSMGVADRPSGVRRIQGGISKRFGKGKEPLEPLPSGAHWNIGDGGPDALERAGVLSIGCFYARLEGFNRWRCFNRLTGFEHITYHNRVELEAALTDQSLKWCEKLAPGGRVSPWASGWDGKGRRAS